MSAMTVVVVAVSFRAGEPAKVTPIRTTRADAAGPVVQGPHALPRALPSLAVPVVRPAPVTTRQPSPSRQPARPTAPSAPRPRQARRSPAPAATPASTTTTVNGAPVDTRYGPVQVQIRVRAHRIVAAQAVVYPQDTSRDRSINDYAVPQLNQETLDAQSAQIDTVSGATYTSDGYRESLQSALDAAHAAGVW
jgi:uncharacterized protein with FMN-binding domain